MVVWRYHGTEPPAEHVTHMHTLLREVATRVLGGERYIGGNMRNIPDHYHAHGRPKGGVFGPPSGRQRVRPHIRRLPRRRAGCIAKATRSRGGGLGARTGSG